MTFIALAFVVFVTIVGSISSVPIYEQCGGSQWGRIFKKCDDGLVCYARSIFYANCRPPNTCPSHWACTIVESSSTIIPPPRVIPANEQCNNESYTVCIAGTACFRRTSSYSECRPQCPVTWQCENDVVHEYEQCGGAIT
ncbi:unnamed protein product [Rotaria sordida]|uniref:Uncharacterized protein n=1 Tax=Rotaria sordida TaxID=392033 RepID=A0A814NNQ5_9BILA|nr:unnamed protein product [Rotaria sordida]